jgi:hypothetical protein
MELESFKKMVFLPMACQTVRETDDFLELLTQDHHFQPVRKPW